MILKTDVFSEKTSNKNDQDEVLGFSIPEVSSPVGCRVTRSHSVESIGDRKRYEVEKRVHKRTKYLSIDEVNRVKDN